MVLLSFELLLLTWFSSSLDLIQFTVTSCFYVLYWEHIFILGGA